MATPGWSQGPAHVWSQRFGDFREDGGHIAVDGVDVGEGSELMEMEGSLLNKHRNEAM